MELNEECLFLASQESNRKNCRNKIDEFWILLDFLEVYDSRDRAEQQSMKELVIHRIQELGGGGGGGGGRGVVERYRECGIV